MTPQLLCSYKSRLKSGRIKRGRFHTLTRYGLFKVDNNVSLLKWARRTAAEPLTPACGRTGRVERLDAAASCEEGYAAPEP